MIEPRRIAIVGYGMGNVTSLANALRSLGETPVIAETPEQLDRATHILLPGVGAFPRAMQELTARGFAPELRHLALEERRPLLGICLGMQLLASVGEEHQLCDGLALIPGRVRRLQSGGLRIPHIGWNDTYRRREDALLTTPETTFYYVHSFHFVPEDASAVSMECSYGETFAAAVQRGNVYGVQFHPEKSHSSGLAVLRRFLEVGKC